MTIHSLRFILPTCCFSWGGLRNFGHCHQFHCYMRETGREGGENTVADVSTCAGLNSSAQTSSDHEPDLAPLYIIIVEPCAGYGNLAPCSLLSFIPLTGSSTSYLLLRHTPLRCCRHAFRIRLGQRRNSQRQTASIPNASIFIPE